MLAGLRISDTGFLPVPQPVLQSFIIFDGDVDADPQPPVTGWKESGDQVLNHGLTIVDAMCWSCPLALALQAAQKDVHIMPWMITTASARRHRTNQLRAVAGVRLCDTTVDAVATALASMPQADREDMSLDFKALKVLERHLHKLTHDFLGTQTMLPQHNGSADHASLTGSKVGVRGV